MKVVLFCGGMGMRLREYSESIPKPLVPIGNRPLMWYLMKYYAHYGQKDFILCLGYKAESFKQYFLEYNECDSNDFVLSEGGRKVDLLHTDIDDWRITFVDTGLNSNIGQRLKAVEKYLRNEEVFLANYTDVLTDLPLPKMLENFQRHNVIAQVIAVKPHITSHFATVNSLGRVTGIADINQMDLLINGGFMILRQDIFKYIRPGEDLVCEPFQRLIQKKQLYAYRYDGFWTCMDTFKDKQQLDDLYARGRAPWEVWKSDGPVQGTGCSTPGDRVLSRRGAGAIEARPSDDRRLVFARTLDRVKR
jgi:glucose-1-phosphate cytidylyltransferase